MVDVLITVLGSSARVIICGPDGDNGEKGQEADIDAALTMGLCNNEVLQRKGWVSYKILGSADRTGGWRGSGWDKGRS